MVSVAQRQPKSGDISRARSGRRRINWGRILLYASAIVLGIYCLFPLYWIFLHSFMSEADIYHWPPYLIPPRLTFHNYWEILWGTDYKLPMMRWLSNSAFVAFSRIGLELTVASLAAYAFSRLEFPGRDRIFFIILATMMIPSQVTLIPMYLTMSKLHWIDTFHALIWPGLAAVFPVFMLRQFFQTIPRELEEAAILDGCNRLKVLWHVILPLSKPAFSALAIFIFMGNWNALFWPLIITNSDKVRMLVPGLAVMRATHMQQRGRVMAAAAFTAVPVMIFYTLFQRHIIEGVTMTGMAGT